MKILKYLDTLDRGGAEMQVLDICRNARRFGLEITLATRGGTLEPEFDAAGIEIIRLERRFPIDLKLVADLRRIISERSIDVVHGYQSVDGMHLHLAARSMKTVRKALSFQGFVQDAKNRLVAKFLTSRVDANIVVSRWLQDWLAKERGLRFGGNTHVIYNGADPERLLPSGSSIKEELGLRNDIRLIGMVGNFYRDARKDQMTVVKAVGEIFNEVKDVHCVFAGKVEPGAERKFEACKEFVRYRGIADRVHFLGGRSDVPDILSELEVFIFSSLHEGLPVAISEAMLAGVPMAVSNIGPHLEATMNGEFGRIFPVKDHRALAAAVIDLLGNKKAADDLASKARSHAAANFSIDAHLASLVRLYQQIR
ncbi:MAG TPA: glycosyltransferase family 4 protein [Pyrinomonadaceae bacterium]|nr:glycosyltransferase family 4 protein [Pyrinomonadaceae bacterium]